MKLSKTITIKFKFCKENWLDYKTYYDARLKYDLNIVRACEWCGYEFEDHNMLNIAGCLDGPIIIVCQKCAINILESDNA